MTTRETMLSFIAKKKVSWVAPLTVVLMHLAMTKKLCLSFNKNNVPAD